MVNLRPKDLETTQPIGEVYRAFVAEPKSCKFRARMWEASGAEHVLECQSCKETEKDKSNSNIRTFQQMYTGQIFAKYCQINLNGWVFCDLLKSPGHLSNHIPGNSSL